MLLNDLETLYLEADIMRAKDERDEGTRPVRQETPANPNNKIH